MASKNTKNTALGDILIINELAKHLKFSEEEKKFTIKLAKKGIIAVETLLEESISKVGKIKRSNEDGEDFIDGSDAKKCIVSNNDSKTDSKSVTISNVNGKKGILRVLVADPNTKQLYYFKIPNRELKNKHNGIKIMFSKNGGMPEHLKKKSIPTVNIWGEKNIKVPDTFSARCWLTFRVNSFKELCG
jgi:hypothetical protein